MSRPFKIENTQSEEELKKTATDSQVEKPERKTTDFVVDQCRVEK
ncbi:hypothetical protein RintRC_3698 [Richelia intracellularis]|nr:hypothetical protein RintRC_3698 [Richelia intracellularis]